MKKFFALLLVLLMSLTATSFAYALYENEMGAPPSNPSARLELTAPQYAPPESTVYVEIRLKDIKLTGDATLVSLDLYWDDSKLSPVILNNSKTDNKEMDAFVVKKPEGWENIFSIKTNRQSGKQYYYLALAAETLSVPLVKEDDQIILKIPFKVKAGATGDMLFWTPHASCYLSGVDLLIMYAMQGDYAVTEARNAVTVTFDTNGGSAVVPAKVIRGGKLEKPAAPIKSGYVFYGWYTSDALNELYDFNKPVTENMTLYAGYTREKYTVSFNTRGGSDIESQTVAHGDKITRPEDPTREGFKFANWFANEGLSTVYDFSEPVTKELTLYAGWYRDSTSPDVSNDISGDTSSADTSSDTSSDDISDTSSDVSDVSADISDTSSDASDDISEETSSEDVSSADETSPDEPSDSASSDEGDESEHSESSAGTVGGVAVPANLLIIAVAIMALAAVGLVISSAIKH